MNSFAMRHEWLSISGQDLPHLKSTMANFSIAIDDQVVTRVLDRKARSTRDSVTVPLYPLAEWIVANWWPLLYEPEVPSKGISAREFAGRHAIRYGREGFILPDLRLFSEGQWTRLAWFPWFTAHQAVDFLQGGEARVSSREVIQQLTDFVDSVVTRLQTQSITDTWLEREWLGIHALSKDERDFCIAAARLGLNAFETDEATDRLIIDVWNDLPLELRDSVLEASPASRLREACTWVKDGLSRVKSTTSEISRRWSAHQQKAPKIAVNDFPWIQGYSMAKELREALKLGDAIPVLEEPNGGDLPGVILSQPPAASFDGIVGVSEIGPQCVTGKQRPESLKFLLARGLADFFFSRSESPLLLTSSATYQQQRGRAFAAEFLAPARMVKAKLSGDEVSREEVEEVALQFGVSPLVIEKQVINHRLAKVA